MTMQWFPGVRERLLRFYDEETLNRMVKASVAAAKASHPGYLWASDFETPEMLAARLREELKA